MAEKYAPRERHDVEPLLRLSGLEPLNYKPNLDNMRSTFLKIGERCNVAGSIMYKKAIVDGDYEKAASIATKQVSNPSLGQRTCCSPCWPSCRHLYDPMGDVVHQPRFSKARLSMAQWSLIRSCIPSPIST